VPEKPHMTSIAAANDIDCFTVEAGAGTAVLATLTELGANLDLSLYDGAVLQSAGTETGLAKERVGRTFADAPNAVLVVRGVGGATSSYVLTARVEPDDPDTLETARLVQLGTVLASIQTVDDADYFKIVLAEPEIPGVLQVTLSGHTADLDIFLFDGVAADPLTLSNLENLDGEQMQWAVQNATTLYVAVEGYQGAVSDYSLKFEVLPD